MDLNKITGQFYIMDLLKSALLLSLAFIVSSVLLQYTGVENNSASVFILAVLIISRITDGYLWGIISSIISTCCVNYFFMYPYYKFNLTISGYPVALISMITVAIITCTMTSQIKRQAIEASRRERAARELYQKNIQLADERTAIALEAEKEKMRSNLLRAISHDLRTPLTTIIGSTSLILEDGKHMPPEEVDKLLSNIKEDAEWLIGMVENLLSITHFQPGETKLKTQPEMVEEVIADAVIKTRKRFPGVNIQVDLPQELIIAPMDSLLIKQVIINLLENAIRHSGDTEHIAVTTYVKDNYAVVQVSDRGRGLSANPDWNDKLSTDSSKGFGIGLPVCESIVKAHKGYFESLDRPEGGAIFRFGLPL